MAAGSSHAKLSLLLLWNLEEEVSGMGIMNLSSGPEDSRTSILKREGESTDWAAAEMPIHLSPPSRCDLKLLHYPWSFSNAHLFLLLLFSIITLKAVCSIPRNYYYRPRSVMRKLLCTRPVFYLKRELLSVSVDISRYYYILLVAWNWFAFSSEPQEKGMLVYSKDRFVRHLTGLFTSVAADSWPFS